MQSCELGDVLDQLRNLENHVPRVVSLSSFSIDSEGQIQVMRISHFILGHKSTHCEELILTLCKEPRRSILLGGGLEISVSEIYAQKVTLDVVFPVLGLDVFARH